MDEFPTLDLDFEAPVVDETPVDETPADETPVDEVADSVPEGGADNLPDPSEEEQPETDGRKAPDDVRKALKALRDSSPENAKAAQVLRDSYGREQAYKAIYPTVKDAQAAQSTIATIESYGGLEGVQQTIADIEEVDALLAAGDPKALDKIIEVSGEGFAKIAPAMLDKLQASNPAAYEAALKPHLITALGKTGLADAFGAVLQNIDLANTPGATAEFKAKFEGQAKEGLSAIKGYLDSLKKTPATLAASADGAPDKLTQREQALATREAASFNAEISGLANTKMNQSLHKATATYLKELKLAPQARADYIQGVYDEVTKLVKADKVYQGQKDALFKSKTKDAGKIATLMNAKFDAVVATAAKTVKDRRYGTASARTTPGGDPVRQGAAAGTGSVEKPILVKELPSRNDVDWDKTTDDLAIRGIRVLKNGSTVKLDSRRAS